MNGPTQVTTNRNATFKHEMFPVVTSTLRIDSEISLCRGQDSALVCCFVDLVEIPFVSIATLCWAPWLHLSEIPRYPPEIIGARIGLLVVLRVQTGQNDCIMDAKFGRGPSAAGQRLHFMYRLLQPLP